MKRAVFRSFGQPEEVVELEDVSTPSLAPGEVRVKIAAAPVNPADINLIQGIYGIKPPLPAIPGMEGCGEVIETRNERFCPGDRVMFLTRAQSWQEEVVTDGKSLFRLPEGIDLLQAAMLKVNPPTAWRLLTGFASLPMGSWIVQNAANSGVGRCVIQLAREMGLRTINGVRRPELKPELEELGADLVLFDGPEAVEQALEFTGGVRPLLAFNAVGGDSALRQLELLADGGKQITYGAMSRRSLKVPNRLLIFKQLSLHGLWITRWLETAPPEEIQSTYTDLANLMAAGSLHQAIDATFPLGKVTEACQRAQQGGRNGRVLIDFR